MFWRKRGEEAPQAENAVPEATTAGPDVSEPQPSASSPDRVADEVPSPAVEAPAAEAAEERPATDIGTAQLEGRVIEAISTVFDPEIPVNIYELGLIYDIEIDGMADVRIKMTLTSPACPVAGSLPGDVQRAVEEVADVRAVDVELVWEPPWTPDRMSEAAKLELGFM